MACLLIVEDDLVAQRSLMRALREHDCVAACNGLEALRLLGEQAFDLVITDVDMPLMNGVDFYKRARELFPELRIIFRTGSKFPGLASIGAPVFSKDWPLSNVRDLIAAYVALGVLPEDVGQGETLSQVGGR